eukprot:gene6181-6419_t
MGRKSKKQELPEGQRKLTQFYRSSSASQQPAGSGSTVASEVSDARAVTSNSEPLNRRGRRQQTEQGNHAASAAAATNTPELAVLCHVLQQGVESVHRGEAVSSSRAQYARAVRHTAGDPSPSSNEEAIQWPQLHFDILDSLNEQQKLVACSPIDQPLMTLAGAGTGKTTAIIARICYLLTQGAKPYHILTITFTNKAAQELKSRLQAAISKAFEAAPAGWSLQVPVVREQGLLVSEHGLQRRLKLYQLLKEKFDHSNSAPPVKEFEKAPSLKIVKEMQRTIDKIKCKGLSATEFDAQTNSIFSYYKRLLENSNAVDFNDLLLLVVALLEDHPGLWANYSFKACPLG